MKSYRVTISDEVLEGVEQHLNYLTSESGDFEVAERWWRTAIGSIYSLERMPHRCPLAPEDRFEHRTIRMLIVHQHLFLYTVDEENHVVRVLRLRHGRQEPKPL